MAGFVVFILSSLVPILDNTISMISNRAENSIGGRVNLIISFIGMGVTPFAVVFFFCQKPIIMISLFVAALPILARFRKFLGIHGYYTFSGEAVLISVISLMVFIIFVYLMMFHPVGR